MRESENENSNFFTAINRSSAMHLSPMMFNSSPEDVCMVSKLIFGISFFNIALKLSYSLFHFFLKLAGDEVLVQLAHLPPHSQHLPPTSPSQVTLALDLHPRHVFFVQLRILLPQCSVSVGRAPVCGEPLEPAVLRFGIQLLSWRLVRDQ